MLHSDFGIPTSSTIPSLRKQPTFRKTPALVFESLFDAKAFKSISVEVALVFPRKWHLMWCHYPDLGPACFWLVENLLHPIRSNQKCYPNLGSDTSRHQYGVSALVSQTSFGGETSGGFAKCRLFSQATIIPSRSNPGQINIFSGHCLRCFKNYKHGKGDMQTICFFLSSLLTPGWETTASLNSRIFKQTFSADTCVFCFTLE